MSDEHKLHELTEKLKKAITASVASSLVKRPSQPTSFEVPANITDVRVVGSNGRYGAFEPVITPSEVIQAPLEICKSESMSECITCGRLQKSNTVCSQCSTLSNIKEAPAYHKR